ncbi:MAG: hypothetical protein ABI409_04000 [Ramlibacter sp.]
MAAFALVSNWHRFVDSFQRFVVLGLAVALLVSYETLFSSFTDAGLPCPELRRLFDCRIAAGFMARRSEFMPQV